jgi:iron-sulfur cluster repair protein YtfE (RIC family)
MDPEVDDAHDLCPSGWIMTPGQGDSQSDQALLAWARATPPPAPRSVEDWSMATLPELVEEIVGTHHRPLRNELHRMGILIRHLGLRHGKLAQLGVDDTFRRFAEAVTAHLDHEEQVVFPLSIVVEHASRRLSETIPPNSDVTAAIRFMNLGHDDSVDALRRLIIMLGKMSASTVDTDLTLIADGLTAMLADFAEHEAKEQGILMPAVIFAEEQIRARASMRNAEDREKRE